jgi:hypothetical protein
MQRFFDGYPQNATHVYKIYSQAEELWLSCRYLVWIKNNGKIA